MCVKLELNTIVLMVHYAQTNFMLKYSWHILVGHVAGKWTSSLSFVLIKT